MELSFNIEGGNFAGAGIASAGVKKTLKQINVCPKIIKRTVVAIYEGEINVVAHAYSGKIKVIIDADKIFIEIKDEGPGIENIEKAMQEGFSTASQKVREMGFGAGMGLPNMKRNSDKLELESEVNKGTTVKMIIFINNDEKKQK